MYKEETDVEKGGENDEAHDPSQEVLEGVGKRFAEVTQDIPELTCRPTHQSAATAKGKRGTEPPPLID